MSAASFDAPGADRALGSAVYRDEDFPGCESFHLALTEAPMSEAPMSETAWRALERTALAMGAREGTTSQHDPLIRSISLKAEARGRSEMLAANVLTVLKARGIEVTSNFAADRALFGELSGEVLMAAALGCTGEADFRRRIREQLDLHTEIRR